MANIAIIPLTPSVAQSFSARLSTATFSFFVQYRNTGPHCWIMDISDSTGNMLVAALPLIPGHNILEQYDYLGFGGELWVETQGDPLSVPTFDNLGVTALLYYISR